MLHNLVEKIEVSKKLSNNFSKKLAKIILILQIFYHCIIRKLKDKYV